MKKREKKEKEASILQCGESCAANAFHTSRSFDLVPAMSGTIDLTDSVNIPDGKRAVIELVTATIRVPNGETAHLRLSTNLGMHPSNLDFVLTPQGKINDQEVLVATHAVRVYSDHDVMFHVERDNPETKGHAAIGISGYFVNV